MWQLLALFSNPSLPTKLQEKLNLQPLKFGQEMKHLLRAIPAQVIEWVTKALRENLNKEQPLCQWRGDAHVLGALDGLHRRLERLERLKREATRKYGWAHGPHNREIV